MKEYTGSETINSIDPGTSARVPLLSLFVLFRFLNVFEVAPKGVERFIPERFVLFQPFGHFVQLFQPGLAITVAAFLPDHHQPPPRPASIEQHAHIVAADPLTMSGMPGDWRQAAKNIEDDLEYPFSGHLPTH